MGRLDAKYRPIIAVDFDGTITTETNLTDFSLDTPLQPHCHAVLTRLKNRGCRIILWTCRAGVHLDEAIRYCELNGIPIDYVNENIPELPWDSRKIYADYYVDDLSFDKDSREIDWLEVEREVMRDPFFNSCKRCGDAECKNCPRITLTPEKVKSQQERVCINCKHAEFDFNTDKGLCKETGRRITVNKSCNIFEGRTFI